MSFYFSNHPVCIYSLIKDTLILFETLKKKNNISRKHFTKYEFSLPFIFKYIHIKLKEINSYQI